ncbi:MAG: PorV/PorQ family protein [Bacteroidetes bacterium]|nr:PorV/PorQ family protein [Bacteroidota bacterium]MCL5739143.1 PorV/PorQ family protein [Bacteroidota bacterium]
MAFEAGFSTRANAGGITLGKYANDFLSIGVGGRALGMGSAFTAVANDVTAGYWNPAGLSRLKFPEIILMHDQRYGGVVSYDYGAAAMSLSKGETVGISAIVSSVSGIPNTLNALIDYNGNGIFDPTDRLDYSKITFFSATDVAVIGSYAKRYSENFAYGANVKFIRRSIGSTYGTGIGFDVGALYTPFTNFSLGANLQNATTTIVAWTTGTTEVLAPTLATGAAYRFSVGPATIMPAVDLLFNADNMGSSSTVHVGPLSADLRAGAEVSYKNIIAIRAGYNEVKQFTVGAGIHLPKLEIDYSFARFAYSGALDDTHRISLKLVLENSKPNS